MKNLFVYLVLVVCFSFYGFAQSQVLLEIDDRKITADEFLHIYQKNNKEESASSFEAMRDYMDLFINFKLKVYEAESLGLDTTKAFKQELDGYRLQLAQPYFTDQSVEEELLLEAYERMKQDVDVSHILIKLDIGASPEDTLKAYNKIHSIYHKLKKGADFESLAKQHSEDESAKVNKGSLNWRTVFGLVYEFETAMYETEVGQFSEPIRSRFGYHIVKVNDKRPAKGKYKVAHIMFITPRGIAEKTLKEIEEKVFMVYDKVKAGENFENLAKEFSDDRQTAANGGNLGWVEVGGKMIKEFENLVFSLEEIGETSEPLRTSYGWHIIKLLDKEDVKDFDDLKADLKNKISNSAQASKSKDVVIANLKKEYNYKLNQKALEDFYVIVTDSIFEGTWDVSEAEQLKDVICEFGDQKMYQYEFAEYLNKFNRKQNNQNIQNFVNSIYDGFHRKAISSYERTQLERKYPSFKFLMQEYHDGILLFDLTDQIVWSKAVADTLGLEKFYNQNKDKYMWDTRYEVKKYTYTNEKKMKALNKMLVKNTSDEKIFAKLNKKDARALQLVINDKFLPSQDSEADELIKQANLGSEPNAKKVFSLDKNTIVSVQQIPPTNKTINEARGIITADYQNYLEQEWIKILRAKYNIVVHEDVLKSIASKK